MSNFFNVIGSRLANAHASQVPESRSKIFHCRCGQTVFFGNTHCVACGAQLGFETDRGELLALTPVAQQMAGDMSGNVMAAGLSTDT
ncbi:MAG: hypothetical protein EOO27_49890, partial [Comamonadaceae bacterium]